jgi:glycosyltransferase involved in cell wall biosynthesis
MRIAAIAPRASRPSYRFRIGQMIPHWEAAGHKVVPVFVQRPLVQRLWSYGRLRTCDVTIIQQRLFHPWELAIIRRLSRHLVYDVDDAVMLRPNGQPDRKRLKRFAATCRAADLVICGNRTLAETSRRYSSRVVVVPTAIDLDRFQLKVSKPQPNGRFVIGWTGSKGSNHYLNPIFPALARAKNANRLHLKVISDTTEGIDFSTLGPVTWDFIPWTPENEVSETASFDIGLMPLPDTPFTRGKCGCKALQYMALGVPAVCSPVGMNADFIDHGRNGLLATESDDWANSIDRLVEQPELREQLATAGYQTVSSEFGAADMAGRLANHFQQIATDQVAA